MVNKKSEKNAVLWRGDLSPMGCEAAPKTSAWPAGSDFATAAQPNGDKSPRHKVMCPLRGQRNDLFHLVGSAEYALRSQHKRYS
nr:hypothetical protein FEE99_15105 [Pseudomonas sp. ef1]